MQSSQIEGTQSGLDDLLAYEVTRGIDGKPPDVVVTQRYVEALQIGLDAVGAHGRSALTLDLLHRLHATLMQDAPPDFPKGRYRSDQAWIGSGGRIEDARFIPAPPGRIEACMREMERSILQYKPGPEEQVALTVVPQLAIAHAQFETIHPYLGDRCAARAAAG